MTQNIREMHLGDIHRIIDYFLNADPVLLGRMGGDPEKFPKREKWRQILAQDVERSVPEKKFYYVIWELDGCPVGHSNINKITFGKEAYMHLHLWDPMVRSNGYARGNS
ncbi:MAG: hypothetical protein D3926_22165 [Desulfobacteraceae bacterium]|nr:MAG: hypothetical protein D3926_22165 [Desulfobacteraceae bacterium]